MEEERLDFIILWTPVVGTMVQAGTVRNSVPNLSCADAFTVGPLHLHGTSYKKAWF